MNFRSNNTHRTNERPTDHARHALTLDCERWCEKSAQHEDNEQERKEKKMHEKRKYVFLPKYDFERKLWVSMHKQRTFRRQTYKTIFFAGFFRILCVIRPQIK